MVEVDGTVYVTEKDFDKAVKQKLDEIAKFSTDHFMETGDLVSGLVLGKCVAGFYRDLKVALFTKEEK